MKLKVRLPLTILRCFLLIVTFSGYAVATESGRLPKAVVDQTAVEFSPVIEGAIVTHVFKIANKGDATLNIPGVYSE